MTSDESVSRGAVSSARGFGLCWILYGVLRLVLAFGLAAFASTATVMFGALLIRVADPYSLMAGFHILYLFAIILSAFCGIFGVLAGFALLSGRRDARVLAGIAAFLSLSDLPIGITLGVYTLLRLRPLRLASTRWSKVGSAQAHPWPAR